MELIRLEDITKTYYLGEVNVPVLRGVSLSIAQGEMVALMGASGSGKTTLMNILGCLDRPSSGKYWLDGQEMSRLSPNQRALVRTAKLGFVFQSFNLLPRTTALQNVVMPLDYSPHRPSAGESRRVAGILLDRVGLADRTGHEPSQMSGGQQQRVAVARALVNHPSLLLADEPTGNLDSHTSVEILRMFQQLNIEGITVILVTHDPSVAKYAHRVIRISDGLIEGDEVQTPYTHASHPETPAAHDGQPTPVEILNDDPRTGEGIIGGLSQFSFHENGTVPFGSATKTASPVPSDGTPGPAGPGPGDDGHPATGPAVHRPHVRRMPAAGPHAGDGARVSAVAAVPCGAGVSPASATAGALPALGTAGGTPALQAAPGIAGGTPAPQSAPQPAPQRGAPTLMPPTFRTALGALRRNKMRSALTALGVIIGVGAVIAMTEIGQGSKIAMQKTIASMGANNLLVLPGAAASGGVSFGHGTAQTLTPEDANEIGRQCPAVVNVCPIVRARAQVVFQNRNWNPREIVGTTPAFLVVREWETLEEGEVFTDRDVRNGNKVCLIGATLKRELFQGESPLGKEVRIQNVSFRVIGVLSPKGANMVGMDQDDTVVAPWTTIKYRVSGMGAGSTQTVKSADTSSTVNSLSNLYPGSTPLYVVPSASQTANTPQPIRFTTVDQIYAKAATSQHIRQAMDQITELLRERHHLRAGQEDDFNLRDMTEMTKALSSTSQLMGALLLVVAAISLIVGGVGIMNIMLVSVTERTREIGLRMAVGARSYHILRQFLVEAVVLCLFGGAIGILLGRGASILVRSVMRWPTETSLPAIIAAVAVSATVGVVFGFYPAWKASRLDPIEALRYE